MLALFRASVFLVLVFTVRASEPPTVVFLAGEYEYHSKETLPPFAKRIHDSLGFNTLVLERPENPKLETIPGLEALKNADLLVVMVRRMTLPENELELIKAYANSKKPIIGIRTASHAFENWKAWDHEILGGNYQNHRGNDLKTTVTIISEKKDHPILQGVTSFLSEGSLYRNSPLPEGSTPLLIGSVKGFPSEPIAWTHIHDGARVFYTSLGHPKDFEEPSFQHLLQNAIVWALDREPSKGKP
jgi:type 1 glutamine amidotransferase